MESINIAELSENSHEWEFSVTVGKTPKSTAHRVTVEKSYWSKLTTEKEKPEQLVERSFRFLLKRERKESILKSFNLKVIEEYFPEFRDEIKL